MLLLFSQLLTYAFLIPALIAQSFNLIVELLFSTAIPSKEDKAKLEIYPVIVEAKIRKCSI